MKLEVIISKTKQGSSYRVHRFSRLMHIENVTISPDLNIRRIFVFRQKNV